MHNNHNNNLRIIPEIKELIPPLQPQEYSQLEQNILAHGCRDPIVLWKGAIIDGYNRYEICTRHGIAYETIQLRFPSREAVILWVLDNQLGRRNLTDAMRIELAARKLECMSQQEHSNIKIAREAGLSERTVQRYMQIKASGKPDLIQKLMAGECKIGTAHRNLEIVSTIREPMRFVPQTAEQANFYRARGATGNVEQMEGMYDFMLKRHKRLPARGAPGNATERLERQYVRVGRLMKKL